ncbi:BLUF domain-containing protein [Aquimarina sp. MMG016]|uniref:BLUF domain-containing protein n=1 Tax=Aquimarina sp. MMG016 TaxID=2822690 RepID=UPI001B39EE8B|nr:BLUF domain-containing protein [Aquimarina sp. MMG016]MBQ4822331.1 BLUF domain-containing protein [Aquimarina sp. MMG016]
MTNRHTITYVSTASSELTDNDILDLMIFVKLQNNINQIMGVLIHSEGNFFQVLQGEEDVIKKLFAKIKQDSRHYNVIKMIDRETKNTSFSSYHSSFTVIKDGSGHTELQKFLDNEKINNPENYKSISYLAQKFMKLA